MPSSSLYTHLNFSPLVAVPYNQGYLPLFQRFDEVRGNLVIVDLDGSFSSNGSLWAQSNIQM